MLPIMEAVMILPEILEPGNSRLARVHNRVVKEALKATLLTHHKKRIPQHFNFWKQKKYNYAKRARGTAEAKRQRDKADLVRTGKSKRRMRTMRIRAGGQATAGKVTVTGILKFKEGLQQRIGAKGITRDVMRDEIARWTEQEEEDAANEFLDHYATMLDAELKSKKVRLRIAGKLRNVGITP